jgi:ketosteroid isomerase-like protein
MPKLTKEFLGDWESVKYEAEDGVEAGDQIVMPFTTHFHGRQDIQLKSEATWIWTFRGNEVVRLTLYQDRAAAFEAVGLTG